MSALQVINVPLPDAIKLQPLFAEMLTYLALTVLFLNILHNGSFFILKY
jgi:hypothetical protein